MGPEGGNENRPRATHRGGKAAAGFEPADNGFAIRPLKPLGYTARKNEDTPSRMQGQRCLDWISGQYRPETALVRQSARPDGLRAATRWCERRLPLGIPRGQHHQGNTDEAAIPGLLRAKAQS